MRIVAMCLLVAGGAMAQVPVIIVTPPQVPEGFCDPSWPKLPEAARSCAERTKPAPKASTAPPSGQLPAPRPNEGRAARPLRA
jgi:hypothetical protein